MEEKVLYLYFTKKMLQKDIAKELDVSKSMVCRIIKRDARCIEEKNNRKQTNKIKHNKDIQRRVESKRKNNNTSDILILKKMHDQASFELSGGRKPISDRAFRNWNSSIYEYNYRKNSYDLKKGINTGADVPKSIKWSLY